MKNESYKSRDTQHHKSLILGVEFKGGFANLTGLMLTLYSVLLKTESLDNAILAF